MRKLRSNTLDASMLVVLVHKCSVCDSIVVMECV
jgi:hypothetical protein